MKYFLDTEFLEGPQKEKFPISLFRKHTPNTIDLISIGIVAEDGREFYAISKDFNLEEAWNRFQMDDEYDGCGKLLQDKKKVYWLRENVLYPIFAELFKKSNSEIWLYEFGNLGNFMGYFERHRNGMKCFNILLKIHGKTNKEIAGEVRDFVMETGIDYGVGVHKYTPIEFYAYYADYDWVVFCWLFGKMMDLPNGFPMYCKDLKQMFDEKDKIQREAYNPDIKKHYDYPKQDPSKSHNAIEDARWNKQLFDFLKNI